MTIFVGETANANLKLCSNDESFILSYPLAIIP